jgi:PEP-CTERM motif
MRFQRTVTARSFRSGAFVVIAVVIGLGARPARADSTYLFTKIPNGDAPAIQANGLNDSGLVVGAILDDNFNPVTAVTYRGGVLTTLGPGSLNAVNASGQAVGMTGSQAVLFSGGTVTPLGLPAGTTYSTATSISDSGSIVGYSSANGAAGALTVFSGGNPTRIDLGQGITFSDFAASATPPRVNDMGLVAGTATVDGRYRGFVYDMATGHTTVLNPIAGDAYSWAAGINARGEVLGWSFTYGGTEHVGIWDRSGQFTTYFTEGTPGYPTTSDYLYFNDLDQIVITGTSDGHSYLVPTLGTRIDLGPLVLDAPAGFLTDSVAMSGINNHGEIIGTDYDAGYSFALTSVPEPSSLILFGAGASIMAGFVLAHRTQPDRPCLDT